MSYEPTFDVSYPDSHKNDTYYDGGGSYESTTTIYTSNYAENYDRKVYSFTPDTDNVGGLYFTREYQSGDYSYYTMRINYYNWNGTVEVKDGRDALDYGEYKNIYINTTSEHVSYSLYEIGIGTWIVSPSDTRSGTFSTNIPIFEYGDEDSINAYKENGDISGAINADYLEMGYVKTTVYIDKSTPPNLKFTWNITDENDKPPKNYIIDIYDVTEYGEIPLKSIKSSGKYSTTWGLIESVVKEQGSTMSIKIHVYFSYLGGLDKVDLYITRNGNYEIGTAINGKHNLFVVRGTGEEDDGYEDNVDKSDAEDSNITVNTANLLTNTYKLTETQLQSLGNFLWSDNFFDNIKLINNSPIENVISCKAIPIDIGGTETTVTLGNVNSGVNALKVSNNFIKKIIGSFRVPRIYNNFVDFEHTKIELYLPLIGVITDLSPQEICGYTITLKYSFDLITGECTAMLFNNRGGGENCIGIYKGNCGIDIPLTSSNRAQVEAGYISDFLGFTGSVFTADVGGVVNSGLNALSRQYTSKSSGSVSGVCAQGLPQNAYLTISENATQIPSNYAETYGRPCNLTKKLKNLSGFTVCDKNIKLSNIECTKNELNEIRQLLSEGVFL